MSCQEEITKKVGVLHARPPAPAVTAVDSATGAAASRFWKGKGFALAGTGDAVETLSRDKTTGVLR